MQTLFLLDEVLDVNERLSELGRVVVKLLIVHDLRVVQILELLIRCFLVRNRRASLGEVLLDIVSSILFLLQSRQSGMFSFEVRGTFLAQVLDRIECFRIP